MGAAFPAPVLSGRPLIKPAQLSGWMTLFSSHQQLCQKGRATTEIAKWAQGSQWDTGKVGALFPPPAPAPNSKVRREI